jgi:divalent metal cation (Fe/Co/Zn/Cd) transporter
VRPGELKSMVIVSKAAQTTEQQVEQGLKSSLVGIAMNLVVALFKCVAGFFGHSFALIDV